MTSSPARTEQQGLSSARADELLRAVGANEVPPARREGVVWRARRQLADPMLLLLFAAGFLTALQGDLTDTAVIGAVILVNTVVSVAQELRAERAVAALRALAAPRARVVRDGRSRLVEAADVVPGDLVELESGDIVPADATVVVATALTVDESALTGESLPVPRSVDDLVSAGTTVAQGRGRAVVTATGTASSLGRVADLVRSARPGPTPLQHRLTRLARQLTIACLAAAGTAMAVQLLYGEAWQDAALSAASLAVAAVPESLPAVLTLSLALGARRMSRHAAIARELRAVETLGSVTLLATDKTGTLTENRMAVVRAWTPAGEHEVGGGGGYAPTGEVTPRGAGSSAGAAETRLRQLARDVVLCNDAVVTHTGPDRWLPVGDPTEAALVAFAGRVGVRAAAARADWPRVGEVPFDSARAWMATTHTRAGRNLVVVKGAPEAVLSRCASRGEARAAAAWSAAEGAAGCRVLAVAESGQMAGSPRNDGLPDGLRLVGLVSMTDPPRRSAKDVVRRLRDAGIRLVMLTGDHPSTAARVAGQVGLDGAVVDASTSDTRPGAVAPGDAAVYARLRPEHKLALVRAWRERGEVVAVTGDGVNDGPALRLADIGVAMGGGGTEVARQAADLVLTDDRLETVVHAVEEGRRIHDNLRRFLAYALSGGLAEVLYVLAGPFLGLVVPILPAQILWINMLTHGLPGVAMGAEPAAADALQRPPVPPRAAVLDAATARRTVVVGSAIGAVTTAVALAAHHAGDDWRTAAFVTLGLAQLGVALALRDRGAARRNWFLTAAVAAALALQVAGVLAPPLRALLETEPMTGTGWATAVTAAALPGLLLWVVRRLRLTVVRPR